MKYLVIRHAVDKIVRTNQQEHRNHFQYSPVSQQQQFLNCDKPYAIGKEDTLYYYYLIIPIAVV